MSNGNCGQQESSCNPLTGVDKLGGRKQPNVRRPSDGSILGDDWRERRGRRLGAAGSSRFEQHMRGYAAGRLLEEL